MECWREREREEEGEEKDETGLPLHEYSTTKLCVAYLYLPWGRGELLPQMILSDITWGWSAGDSTP